MKAPKEPGKVTSLEGYLYKLVSADGLKSPVRWTNDLYSPVHTVLRPRTISLKTSEVSETDLTIKQRTYRFKGRYDAADNVYYFDEMI